MTPTARAVATCAVAALCLCRIAGADDWPTYAHDNARSGVTAEQLSPPLALQWVFRSPHPPVASWSDYHRNRDRAHYDDAPHVAAAGDSVYFCSSAENRVYALDAGTGEVRWTRWLQAPPRMAPTAWRDRVLVGADDGHVYCFDSATGDTAWKLRAAPATDLVIGQGRIMSLWPVRTGVMVAGDTAYFGAGLFGSQGVHLYAVRADDGQVLWHESSTGKGSPQGYMLAWDDRIICPQGRTYPVSRSAADGKWSGSFNPGVGKGMGGPMTKIGSGVLFNVGAENIVGYSPEGKGLFRWSGARRVVVDDGIAYLACGGLGPDESGASGHLSNVEKGYAELLAIPVADMAQAAAEVMALHDRLSRALRYGSRIQREGELTPELAAERERVHGLLDDLCRWRLDSTAADSLIKAAPRSTPGTATRSSRSTPRRAASCGPAACGDAHGAWPSPASGSS